MLGIGGYFLMHKWIYRRYRISTDSDTLVSGFFNGIGVLFGLLVGLVAIASWENYGSADQTASNEAAEIAILYRDVSVLEQPIKAKLQEYVKDYARTIINVEWPSQQKGNVDVSGIMILTDFHGLLATYKAKTPEQQIFMAQAVAKFDDLITALRARQDATKVGIPAPFWIAMISGSFISIFLSYFFHCQTPKTHVFLIGLYSAFLGVIIWLVASVDNPFRGEMSISSYTYENVLKHLDERDPEFMTKKKLAK